MSRSNRKSGTKQALRRKHRESKRLAKRDENSIGRTPGNGAGVMEKCVLCWDNLPKSETLTGSAWGITGTICKECIEYVGNEGFKETLKPTMSYAYTSQSDWDWTAYQDVWDAPSSSPLTGYTYVACHHHMVPLQFEGLDNTYTVHLTGSSSLSTTPGVVELPTVGVYLDDGWLRGRLATNTTAEVDMSAPASLYVGWPDFGVVEVDMLSEAIEWTLPYLHNKNSIIEIACMGGHGRTGTFVAALMIREGWAVADAMSYIRGGYCDKAIESKVQEDLLTAYSNLLTGVIHETVN